MKTREEHENREEASDQEGSGGSEGEYSDGDSSGDDTYDYIACGADDSDADEDYEIDMSNMNFSSDILAILGASEAEIEAKKAETADTDWVAPSLAGLEHSDAIAQAKDVMLDKHNLQKGGGGERSGARQQPEDSEDMPKQPTMTEKLRAEVGRGLERAGSVRAAEGAIVVKPVGKGLKVEREASNAVNDPQYWSDGESDEDDEDDAYDEEFAMGGTLSEMNMSENLKVLLGLIEPEAVANPAAIEWEPPAASGLDNSAPLIDKNGGVQERIMRRFSGIAPPSDDDDDDDDEEEAEEEDDANQVDSQGESGHGTSGGREKKNKRKSRRKSSIGDDQYYSDDSFDFMDVNSKDEDYIRSMVERSGSSAAVSELLNLCKPGGGKREGGSVDDGGGASPSPGSTSRHERESSSARSAVSAGRGGSRESKKPLPPSSPKSTSATSAPARDKVVAKYHDAKKNAGTDGREGGGSTGSSNSRRQAEASQRQQQQPSQREASSASTVVASGRSKGGQRGR